MKKSKASYSTEFRTKVGHAPPQNGRTRFVTQVEYDKSLISPSHQKLAGDVLQKDDKRMKFQLKARWMRTTTLPGRIRNSLSAYQLLHGFVIWM